MALLYYLAIDGVDGGSTATGHEGAFAIADYSLDVSALAAGRPTFSPLTVDLDSNSGLATLFRDAVTGQHIRSVELQGVSSDGTTVYDLKLGEFFSLKPQNRTESRSHLEHGTAAPRSDAGSI